MKKSIQEEHHHNQHVKKDHIPSTKKLDTNDKKSSTYTDEHKKETVISSNAKRENNPTNEGNSEVASVELDNSSEKEKEKLNQINLRDLLAKTGNIAVTSAPKPYHSDIKSENHVSSKQSKAGLDQVSFIGMHKNSFIIFTTFSKYYKIYNIYEEHLQMFNRLSFFLTLKRFYFIFFSSFINIFRYYRVYWVNYILC